MLIRIVKMEFREEDVNTFLEIFGNVKSKILSQEGCQHLELLQADNETTLFTYSYWVNEESLNNYRHSELFKGTWKMTKALFATPALAWSTNRLHSLDKGGL